MAPPTIPVLRVAGSHREVGAQIGAVCAETFRRAVSFDHTRIPGGRTRADQLALADRYRDAAYAAYPWYRDELEGAAEAAGVEPRALFACVVEEIWYEPYARRLSGRCTDVVAVPPATRDDHVLVAHNNDMPRSYQDELVALEIAVAGEPTVFAVGNGVWLSCGWNDAGISMTGNELAPLDERVGVPREVQFRSMLRQPTLERAVGDALRHDRASSYNQVLVTRLGEVVNIEGSATDAELLGADEYGHLVHTNHYVCPSMTRYEGDPAYAERSAKRYARAAELLARAGPAMITADALRAVLSDHEGAPDAVCRHHERSPESSSSGTTFWWIADLTEGFVRFGRGNPCDSIPQEHRFSPAEESAA